MLAKIGNWRHGMMDGTGKYKWPNEMEYEGQFRKDRKEGIGEFRWPEKKWRGNWKNGKMHGIGILTYKGRIY
jgi:hypothetical protein